MTSSKIIRYDCIQRRAVQFCTASVRTRRNNDQPQNDEDDSDAFKNIQPPRMPVSSDKDHVHHSTPYAIDTLLIAFRYRLAARRECAIALKRADPAEKV